jgi:hypothetical protein
MRPGRHPWAENNTYAGGPDAGSNSKTETTTLLRDDGYYRTRRPAPDLLNWQLNRGGLAHQFAAKMLVSNLTQTDNLAFPAGNEILDASCSMVNATTGMTISLFFIDAAPIEVIERFSRDGVNWAVPGSSPVTGGLANAILSIDADSDGTAYRCLAISNAPGTNQIWYNNNFAASPWLLAAVAGVARDWLCIGSDRNTAGGAQPLWMIGDSGTGGTVAPRIYGSAVAAAPANFADVGAGLAAIAVGNQINFVGHTCHPAGALGPDDAGNPSWLALSTAPAGAGLALVSADGATWSQQAHGLGAWQISNKSAAYSRTAGRWVVIDTAGGTWYSDDNGVTWAAGVTLPMIALFPGTAPQIKCDGYGTFVISDVAANLIWVSTDEGITWTAIELDGITAAATAMAVEVGFDQNSNWNTPGTHPTFFTVSAATPATPLLETYRTLVY